MDAFNIDFSIATVIVWTKKYFLAGLELTLDYYSRQNWDVRFSGLESFCDVELRTMLLILIPFLICFV